MIPFADADPDLASPLIRSPVMRRSVLILLGLSLAACGGSNPAGPGNGTPTPPPADTYTVQVTVFDDENRNGRQDGTEGTLVEDVQVEVGGRTGVSGRFGVAVVGAVPRGTYTVVVRPNTLPPYYLPGAAISVNSPQAPNEIAIVPVILPVGDNNPRHYLCSGDSISQGDSSAPSEGYRGDLVAKLEGYLGRPTTMRYLGGGTGNTSDGRARLAGDVANQRPGYTLMQWGVNDYLDQDCGGSPTNPGCRMKQNYIDMIHIVKAAQSLPVIATITPANTGYDERAPVGRNVWVKAVNDIIRQVAKDEHVLLVDLEPVFLQQPSLSSLFYDHVHPNSAGYALIANTYFRALTKGVVSSTFEAPRSLLSGDPFAPVD
jgi:lysophospholipase L1-like esterase